MRNNKQIMEKNIDKYIVKSTRKEWIPLVENNLHYEGVIREIAPF